MHFLDIQILSMVPQSTANKLTLDIINISPVILHGQKRLPGYVHLFIVPTKSVATTSFYKKRVNYIKRFMSWNGYPRRLTRKLISLFSPSTTAGNLNTENVYTDNNPNLKKIRIPLSYIGKHGTRLTNSFVRKITSLLKSQCKIIINWQTADAGSFVSLKDPTPKQYKSSTVYEFKCPGCYANYIRKTDPCLYTRIKEHSSQNTCEIYFTKIPSGSRDF